MEKSNLLYLYTYVYELFLLCIVCCIIGYTYSHNYILYGSIVCFIILLCFYRNNLSITREALNKYTFLSPASNKITQINKSNSNETIVSSYLSPFNKHFMISPCDCVIVEKIYKPQRKTDAECMRHVCKDNDDNIFYMDQIVSKPLHWGWIPSILYNRCVSFVNVGQQVKQGERIGLIRFGSNMEYSVPCAYQLLIQQGDYADIGNVIARKK